MGDQPSKKQETEEGGGAAPDHRQVKSNLRAPPILGRASAPSRNKCWSIPLAPAGLFKARWMAAFASTRSGEWLCSAAGERPGALHRQRAQPALERRHVIGLLATGPQLLCEHVGSAAPLVVSVNASAGEQRPA